MKNGHDFTAKSNPGHSPNAGLHGNAGFAREATISAFGWHHARALDQADFVDRPPRQIPGLVSEAGQS